MAVHAVDSEKHAEAPAVHSLDARRVRECPERRRPHERNAASMAAVRAVSRLLTLHQPECDPRRRRQRLSPGPRDESRGHGPSGDRRRNGLAVLDRARDHAAVGEAQGELPGNSVVIRNDADERPDGLPVDEPPVLVDEIETAVLAHAELLELDLVAVDERERLHRRDRDPGDGALHHRPPA